MCTSGVREAVNRAFFIDHIRHETGIELEIIEPADEIYIKYVGVKKMTSPASDSMRRTGC